MSRWCYDKGKTCWHAWDLGCQMTSQLAVLFIIKRHWPAQWLLSASSTLVKWRACFNRSQWHRYRNRDPLGGWEVEGEAFLIAALAFSILGKALTPRGLFAYCSCKQNTWIALCLPTLSTHQNLPVSFQKPSLPGLCVCRLCQWQFRDLCSSVGCAISRDHSHSALPLCRQCWDSHARYSGSEPDRLLMDYSCPRPSATS